MKVKAIIWIILKFDKKYKQTDPIIQAQKV